jgi:hypothetical protein
MLVYGDQKETIEPRRQLERIREQLGDVEHRSGLDRHAKLVGALVEAGRLVQGLADAGRRDTDVADRFLHELARCVVHSRDSEFRHAGDLPATPSMDRGGFVELRQPEGFAFYALYPEAYVAAARRLDLFGPPRIIGIRSIGTTLGAVVAATLGAPPAITVRPFGDPFERRVELPPDLIDANSHYVIVDEGPGLSGSSFGAVADALRAGGVELDRIAFLPSHSGDIGPKGSDVHRLRWSRAQRAAAEFDDSFLRDRFGPLEEFVTGDAWSRRKYRAGRDDERVLIKFAGLGSIGERKFEMARALYSAGFVAEPIGLVHGFLVERWRGDGLRLAAEDKPTREMGEYIGARARLFPASDESGASLEVLMAMCRRNLSAVFGEEISSAVDRKAEALPSAVRRVRTDNKLDREEWLRLFDGQVIKTDAVDHHCGHDLIGCQGVAWDVAGAITEFALDADDTVKLVGATENASGLGVDPRLLEFYRIAYCCFRLGQAKLSAQLCSNSGETERLNSRAVRYETAVLRLLQEQYCCFTPRESLVD